MEQSFDSVVLCHKCTCLLKAKFVPHTNTHLYINQDVVSINMTFFISFSCTEEEPQKII